MDLVTNINSDSEEDLTSFDTTSSGKKYRYVNKAEASHIFLLATNHKLFQQGDFLDWQIMKLNSLIKVDEQIGHGCSVIAILSKNSLKLYKNLLTHNHFITKNSQSKKAKEFLYNSPTSVSGFFSESESSLTDNTSSYDLFSERKSLDIDLEKRTLKSGVVVPSSSVHIFFTKYNIVIVVDFSPSMTIVDPETGEVLIDRVYDVLAKLIEMLVQPIKIPETNMEFSPEIRLTITALGSLVKPIITLCQDVLLTLDNYKEIGKNVKIALESVEESLSHKKSKNNENWYHSSFEEIIDDALLPFEFLPQEPSPSLFIITDSIMNMKNLTNGFKKLKEKDVSFSIVNIVSKKQKSFTYSHIFNQEILEFICKAVDGTLIEYSFFKEIDAKNEKRKENKLKMKISNEDDPALVSQTRTHLIHQAVLFKSSPYNVVERENVSHPLMYTPQKNSNQNIIEKIKDYKIQGIELESLLKMRIRENFSIEDIQYSNESLDPTNITMRSYFFPSIDIKYIIKLVPYLEKKDSKKGFIFYIEIQVISPPSFHERLMGYKKNYVIDNTQNSKEICQQIFDTINSIYVADTSTIKLLNLSISTPKNEISSLIAQIPKTKLYTVSLPCLILQNFSLRQKRQLGEIVVKKMLLETSKYTESNENEHDVSVIKIIERLGSALMIKKNLFIKFLQNDDTDEYDSMDYFGFCLIELEKHSSSLTKIILSFFNIPTFAQNEFIEHFTNEIQSNENFQDFDVIMDSIIPRVMKRLPYSNEDTELYTKNLYKLSPHYVSYLKHESLLWNLKDVEGIISPLLSLIFSQRSIEGFTLLSFKNSPIFYRTIKVKTQYLENLKPSYTGVHKREIKEKEVEVLLFYSVHVLHKTKQIITEFFIEPRDSYFEISEKFYDRKEIFNILKEWFQSVDSNFISSFYTFETIYKECLTNRSSINLLKIQQKMNLDFTLEKIYQKGKTKTLFLNFFSSDEIKNALALYEKPNKELYERFEKIIFNINKVELPNQMAFDKKKPDRCFGKVIDEKEKIILMTFLPSLFEDSLLLRIHECSQSNLSKLVFEAPELLSEFFKIEKKEEDSIFDDHSDLSSNYISFLQDCHSYSFTYGTYKMLQEKTELDIETSFIPSVEACVEYMVEIDLSEFLEAILTSKGNFFKSRGKGISQAEEMKQSFESILFKYFSKVPNTDFHFYLKDQSIKNIEGEQRKNSMDNEIGINKNQNDQEVTDETLNDFIDNNSQNSSGSGTWNEKEILKFMDDLHLPVFFRMECVSRTQNSEEENRFPVTNIPVEKLAKKQSKKEKLFEDIYDVSQTDDWISTITEKKTILRLVCITLPPDLLPLASKKFNPSKETVEHLLNHHDPNRFSYCKSKYSNFDYEPTYESDTNNPFLDVQLLPLEVRTAIKKTKKRIQSLISRIILNSLLHTSPTVYTIEKVVFHLRNISINTFVKYNLDLNFVDKELGIRLFQKEISKNDSPIIKPIGDYYIVLFKSNEKMPYYLFQEKEVDNIKVKIHKERYKDEDLEFPYWIILQMKKSKVKVLFYWPYQVSETQKENVISLITNSIKKISKTVNTLILLKEVEETRFCSSFLLASNEKKEVSSIDKVLGSKSIFKENEFACPLVHTLTFSLHKRLEIDIAFQSIYSSIFKSHIVSNRSNMYIFKEKSGNDIFFIKLKTINPVTSPRTPETPKQVNYSITTEGTDETFFLKLDISGGKLLALEFFGLRKPTTEMINTIKSNIENKLAANVLTILSQSIKNNPNFKFTLDDLEFIRPFSKKPNSATLIDIPDMVEDHFFFLLLLRQNLLSYLRFLNSSEDKGIDLKESKDFLPFNPSQFGFIFQDFGSQSISKHLQHEAPGRISCIYFSIVNNQGKILKNFPKTIKTEYETFQFENVEPENVETKYIENGKIEIETMHGDYTVVRLKTDNPKTKYRLLLEIWVKGQIDIESLVDRIVVTCNQTIIDYVMEKAVLHKKTSTTHYIYRKDIVLPFQNMILQKRQLLMGSSSIFEVKKKIYLPVWVLRTVTKAIEEKITQSFSIKLFQFIDIDRGDKLDTYIQLEPKVFSSIIGANDLQITYLASNFEDANNLNLANNSHLTYEDQKISNRHFGILINITNTEIWILSYNIKKNIFESFWKKDLEYLLSYVHSRILLLNTILNQKMGLFNHSSSSSLLEYEDTNKCPTFSLNNIDLLLKNDTNVPSSKLHVTNNVKTSLVNSLDFNSLLRGVYYDVPNEDLNDPLLSHGTQFKNIILQHQTELEKQNQISGIYNILNRLQDSSHLFSNSLQISDFKTILDNSRLYHYYRTPILFTKEQKETKIHRKLLESFLEQYVKYLESLDVVILAVVDGSKESEKNQTGENKPYQPSTVYLQKIMKGGVLIIELGFEKPIAYLNIYVSDAPAIKKRYQTGEKKVSNRKLFLQSVTQLKHALHLNSFVYDFHLRHFIAFVREKEVDYPSFDIIEMLKIFENSGNIPYYAKSMMKSHMIDLSDFKEIPLTALKFIFAQISKYPDYFKVDNLEFRQLDSIILFNDEINDPDFLQSTLLYIENDHTVGLYIMRAETKSGVPESTKKDKTIISNELEQYAKGLEQRVKDLLISGYNHYKIYSLWNAASTFTISPNDFDELKLFIYREPLENLDKSLSVFQNSSVPWNEVFYHLHIIYKEDSGVIKTNNQNINHFLIKKENEMLDIEFHIKENSIKIFLLKKEKYLHNNDSESKLITNFVNTCTSLLFKMFIEEMKTKKF